MLSIKNLDQKLALIVLIALVLEVWMLFSDVHFLWKPSQEIRRGPQVAEILTLAHDVKIRTSNDLHWASALKGKHLFEGDEIMTGPGSAVTLQFSDGRSLNLGENSVIALRKSKLAKSGRITLVLTQGILQQRVTEPMGNADQLEIQTGGKRILSSNSASFTIENTKGVPKVNINQGKVEVNEEGFQFIRLEESVHSLHLLESLLPQRVPQLKESQLKEPFQERIPLKSKLLPPILLRPKVTKEVEGVSSPLEAPSLKKPVIHYSNEGAHFRGASRILRLVFEVFVTSAYAEEESKPSKYSVDLSWHRVIGAKGYRLQISSDSEFRHPLLEVEMEKPVYTWHANTPGYYFWRVAAMGDQHELGPFSEFMTFSIQAERNKPGDESTYESFLDFDEYSMNQNRLRIYYGPFYKSDIFSNYAESLQLNTYSFIQAQAEYDYGLNSYYSAHLRLNTTINNAATSNFQPAPGRQRVVIFHETQIYLGIERRFFQPKYYLTAKGGILMSYIDRPTLGSPGRIDVSNFAYFGPYCLGGIHRKFFSSYMAGVELGGLYQSTGDSYQFGQLGVFELKRILSDNLGLGFWLQEKWISYRGSSAELNGIGHSFSLFPMAFVEFTF